MKHIIEACNNQLKNKVVAANDPNKFMHAIYNFINEGLNIKSKLKFSLGVGSKIVVKFPPHEQFARI